MKKTNHRKANPYEKYESQLSSLFVSIKIILLFVFFVLFRFSGISQNFYALDTIQKIEIQFWQANWDYILDTAKAGSDSYTMAQWVKINGVQFDSAGVKYKGNSSYSPSRAKNPLHIELDHFKNQDYMGYKDIKLSNGFKDPAFVREVLSYYILRNYMHASLSNYAQVYINGQYIGLYANTEAVTKTFVDDRFFSNVYPFFFMDMTGDLRYKGPDSSLYFMYTMKSTYGWNALVNLCYTLKYNINGIENVLDVDRALWMLAFDNVLVNLDSYLGNLKHNYYAYQDHNGRFNPIVWDVNEGFGSFTNVGTGPPLTISQMQTMSLMLHSNDSLWPLVKNLLAIPMYKRMYIAHAKTIVDENFGNNQYYTDGQYLQSVIDTAVQSDPNKLYTYSDFLNNLTSNVGTSPTLPGITYLMNARTTYLNSTTEFQQVAPTLSNIQPSDTFPLLNSTIYITAQVSNATAVYCGLRSSVMDRFIRYQMLDDGLNGDGSAGDGVYGITVAVTSPEIHYYIYAENNNAGIFSPERAEHEWYTLSSDYATITAGEVVINELAAMNSTIQANGLGNYNDWIELYNTTTDTILLDNLYLSDDFANPAKWQYPVNTTILPNGYLIIWADNDVFTGELHSGFNLSGTGEQLILSYANGNIIDSVTFPAQTTDITYGRYPNGTGPFVFMPPTFNAVNSLSGVEEQSGGNNGIFIYPNPTSGKFVVQITNQYRFTDYELEIYNVFGEKVYSAIQQFNNSTIDISSHPNGMYFLRLKTENQPITKKLLLTD